jgi:transcriptional regulator of acetoin/glycerol metabolism
VLASGERVVSRRLLAAVMPEVLQEPSVPLANPAVETRDVQPHGETPRRQSAEPSIVERPSREEFLSVYEATGRNIRATSKHFGRDRRQIYRWLELYGIER